MMQDPKSDALVLKATGPRTPAGKMRSRKNALLYGIHAKQLLLDCERPEDFSSLHQDLRKDFRPKGAFEECLVFQLATVFWRKWRLLKAEAAEIKKVAEFLKHDAFWTESGTVHHRGDALVTQQSNPVVLQRIIARLTRLRDDFEYAGCDAREDRATLEEVYGDVTVGFPAAFFIHAIPDKRPEAIDVIDKELARLKSLKDGIEQCTKLASLVPQHEVLDHLQRYEAHLSREISRFLGQLAQFRCL